VVDVAQGSNEAVLRKMEVLLRAGALAGLSDGQLLGRFLARRDPGAEAAFEALVRRHGPMVLAACRGVLRDAQEAEDAFQAAFLVLARRAAWVRDPDRLGPWLHRVAVRIAVRAKAEAARRRDREARAPGATAMAALQPDLAADHKELCGVLHEEVDRLPEKYRTAVVLCYLEGETYEAAAARLRLPVGTVRSRLARARDQLRGRLARRGLVLPATAVAAALTAQGVSAAVPAHLVQATLQAVTLTTAGQLAASAKAVAYAEGLLRHAALARLKAAALVVLAVGVAGAGVGTHALRDAAPVPPAVALPTPPPPAQPAPTDLERLQGVWIVVAQEPGGLRGDEVLGDRLVIEGTRFTWIAARGAFWPEGETRGELRLDPDAAPGQLDLVLEAWKGGEAAPDNRPVYQGIYRLEGVRLTLCLGHAKSRTRPTTFTTNAKGTQVALTLKRLGVTVTRDRSAGRPAGVDTDPEGKEEP
jgi:RNA polymerase sigma factor (sigma-70 family)